MKRSLLEEVRVSCRQVAEDSVFVEIDQAVLAGYAASLPQERLLLPEMDPAIHYLGHGPDTLAYFLTLDAINFGSGFFPDIFGGFRSGYRTVAAALSRHLAGSGPLSPERLGHLSAPECAQMLGLDVSSPAVLELTSLYAQALNELGAFLTDHFDSDFTRLVAAAGNSGERLVEILAGMSFFRDVALLGGITVPFYKRAQLTVVDLFIAFDGQGYGRFDDLDRLTICADNLVPHVLRLDGVLRYREELAERIDRGEPLAASSAEEVEVRACAVHAAELLLVELQKRGNKVNALLLDNYLWHRGQQPAYRARPRHRTRTVFY